MLLTAVGGAGAGASALLRLLSGGAGLLHSGSSTSSLLESGTLLSLLSGSLLKTSTRLSLLSSGSSTLLTLTRQLSLSLALAFVRGLTACYFSCVVGVSGGETLDLLVTCSGHGMEVVV